MTVGTTHYGLEPINAGKPRLSFGMLKGKVPPIPDAFFFDSLPEEELRLWEGGHDASRGHPVGDGRSRLS